MPRWLKIGTGIISILLVGVLAFGAYWAFRLQGNISKAALGAGSDKTEAAVNDSNDRMQILILGSDSRDGKNSQYGTSDDATGYGHSDVMMLMDISADNKRVSVVSFPRDLLVDTPKCTDQKTKKQFPAQQDVMINAAMTEAGIGCAVDTVNKLTGLEIDHFMMADFNAVKELSNTVGGVEVCISDAVYDPDSRLRLPKGTSKVQGEQALAFLRARHAFADGGDLGRIKAQQGFLSSLTRKMKSDGTLSNPVKMLEIADVVTRNLTIDEGLASIPTLLTVGNRLKNIDVGKVAFVAVPTVPAVSDPNRLQVAEPAASQLFAAMRKDIDLTDPTAPPSPSASASPAASASAAPTPSETAPAYDKALQPVTVANGSGTPARAQEIIEGPHRQRLHPDQPVRRRRPWRPPRSTTARVSPTWPPTSPPCWGSRRSRCCRPPASSASRSTWAAARRAAPRAAPQAAEPQWTCPMTSSTRPPAMSCASRPTRR